MRHGWHFSILLGLASLAISCGRHTAPEESEAPKPIGRPLQILAPLGLPVVPVPENNLPTADTIALGEKLYFSNLLSSDKTMSCANCHNPKLGFADGRRVSIGVGGKAGKRNAPTVLNAAYNSSQFWDGRAASLEAQASGPMFNAIEMAHTLEGVVQSCSNDPEIRAMVERAFGPGPVTIDKLTMAIASFERTLVSGNSPFDRYFYGNEKTALSESAKRGLAVFRDTKRGNCVVCHTIDDQSALFTDGKFHNLGVGMNSKGELTDMGRYIQTMEDSDTGAFKTPTLRNVTLTAPYMHDGSAKTLKEVVDFYVGGGNSNEHLDKEIKTLNLTKQEREDLVAFLESLTGDLPVVQVSRK